MLKTLAIKFNTFIYAMFILKYKRKVLAFLYNQKGFQFRKLEPLTIQES